MQFSRNWLKEFVDIKISDEELCDQLTMLGLEVDSCKKYQSKLTGKDAIIKHLLEKLFDREFAALQLIANEPRPASEKLMLFAEKMIDDIHSWSRFIPIMYEFLGRLFRQSVVQEAFKKYMGLYYDLITPIIQQGIDAG